MEYIKLDQDYFLDFIGRDYHVLYYNNLFKKKIDFRFKVDESVDLLAKTTVDAMNLLLNNKRFIEINGLITNNDVWDYFRDMYNYYKDYYWEKECEVKLKSNKLRNVELFAYFTKNDLKYMNSFRSYKLTSVIDWEPEQNFDSRVVKRASMKLLLDKLTKHLVSKNNEYKLLDLNEVNILDYNFGLISDSAEY